MQFLPVVQRELLVAARKRGTYLSRTLSAGILLAFFTALLSAHSSLPTFTGAHMLMFLSTVVFFECMVAGVRYTSDCLSEEKREGTLGLLFLTNLTGFDVVLGKMIARSIGAVFNLIAVIPILALTVLIGGVVGAQITSISIALFVATIFSLCAGAFISSRGFRERGVLVGTMVFLLIVTFLPILLSDFLLWLLGIFQPGAIDYRRVQAIQFLSPLYAFREAGRGLVPTMQSACWTLLGLSAAFVVYASWRVRHGFGEPDKAESTPAKALRAARKRSPLRSMYFARNPILWLAHRARTRGWRILLLCAWALVFGVFARIALDAKWNWSPPVIILGSYGLHALFKFLITAETARQLNEDKRSGALELLLTTPIHHAQIIRGQITGTRKVWLPAAICIGLMNLTWMTEETFIRDVAVLLPCSLILLFFDSYALAWRAVLNALKGDRYTVTVFKTYFRVIVPPIAVIAMVLAMRMGTATSSRTMEMIFVTWTIGSVVYDLILIADARFRLRRFRALAAGDERIIPKRRTLPTMPVSIVPAQGAAAS